MVPTAFAPSLFVTSSPFISSPPHPTYRVGTPPPLRMAVAMSSAPSQVLSTNDYTRLFQRAVPDLKDSSLYKGACGRVAVVGGSLEYTGAPYFAATASLRGGGELAHVFCAEDAAIPIKSYSPELIVHPGWQRLVADAPATLAAAHAVVLGPGLGRCKAAEEVVHAVVAAAVDDDAAWPLVVDADALFFVAASAELRELLRKPLKDTQKPRVYITPNRRELERLCAAVKVADSAELAQWFCLDGVAGAQSGRVVVVEKGASDFVQSIEAGEAVSVDICTEGTKKRCGGQGDVLSGLTALFAAWTSRYLRVSQEDVLKFVSADSLHTAAAVAAAVTTRRAGLRAFAQNGRSMVAGDMLDHVGPAFDMLETGPLQ